jgi:hypothetical protein
MAVPRLSSGYTVDSVIRPWLDRQAKDLGLLKNTAAVSKAASAFASEALTNRLASPSELHSAGAPLSFTGATPAGYQLRGGVIFPYGQAYLLHYQEGEPEVDDHLFRLSRRAEGKRLRTLWEFGTCIGDLDAVRLSPRGPEFLLLVESSCGSGYTVRLMRMDAPEEEALRLPMWQGDIRTADLDGDGQLELIHSSREKLPASIGLRLTAAADYTPAMAFWHITAWRWDGKRWQRTGERWSRKEP